MDQHQTPIVFKSAVNIIVDHRERACKVPEFLAKIGNAELSFTQLLVGDYVVDNLVLFERKTIKDFAQSIIDARLFRQAVRLNRAQMKTAIILEGSFSGSRVSVSREAMQGALISLMLVFGIPVLRAVNAEESARLIVYTARQLAKREQGASVWRSKKPKKSWNHQLHVLQGLPGIGRDRAIRLLEHFGTVLRCFAASEEELCEVDGIGAKTARKIYELVCLGC